MKISVVVPVFNSEHYINACINSIINQTHSDFELLLIDDGSTDQSGSICDSYAARDSRVQVIHQKNNGAGAARNIGIDKANGTYIVFVDSDDKLEKTYLERLSTHDEDVVFIDVDDIDAKNRVVKREYMSSYQSLSHNDFLRKQMTGSIPWGGVRKCVKLKHIKDNNIKFSNHKIGEEAIYSYQVLRLANTVGFIEGTSYYCLLHSNSLSQSMIDDPLGQVSIDLRQKVIEMGDYPELSDTTNAFIIVATAGSVYKMAQKYPLFVFRNKAKKRVQCMRNDLDKTVSIDYQHVSNKLKIFIWLMERRCWIIIWMASRIKR